MLRLIISAVLIFGFSAPTFAGGYKAEKMWGTTTSQKQTSHVENGAVAGQVNAAKKGMLLPGNISIYSIGSQSVVNTIVTGNGNGVSIDAEQRSTNSGDVTNEGDITTNN